jgi:hypothetical protein
MTFIQKINPINKEEEKKKFLFDPLYNPQFEYAEEITPEELNKYGPVSSEYLDLAKSIIDKVMAKYGNESKYLEEVEGRILSRDEVVTAINDYLKELNLQDTMMIQFSRNFIARTSVHDNIIRLRLPIEHREHSLQATLNHEIGTHYLKNLNDLVQPWHKKRSEFGLHEHLETEEGVAVLHFYISMEEKFLWLQALYYYAACKAKEMSFSQLYKHLEKYVDNKERRWKVCLRAKRGFKDTSEPGAVSKDQVYLSGVIKVSKWLKANDYQVEKLYVGKVSIADLEIVDKIADRSKLKLPSFISDKKIYRQSIEKVCKVNGIG